MEQWNPVTVVWATLAIISAVVAAFSSIMGVVRAGSARHEAAGARAEATEAKELLRAQDTLSITNVAKLDQIHQLTNSNYTALKNQFDAAQAELTSVKSALASLAAAAEKRRSTDWAQLQPKPGVPPVPVPVPPVPPVANGTQP